MTSEQLKILLSPPDIESSRQRALQLLNSRFKSLSDLDGLEVSVQEAYSRKEDLTSQLSLSQSRINALVSETRSAAETQLHSAQELSLLRHSLTDDLAFLSQELVSAMSDGAGEPTLLEDIETLHRGLKELESVKGYVQIIQHAQTLSEAAVRQIRTSTSPVSSSSVTEYQSLQEFVSGVSKACSHVEDGAGQQSLQLVRFLEDVRDRTWSDMKAILSGTLLIASEKLHWPTPIDYVSASSEDRKAFESAFLDLLRLQSTGDKLRQPVQRERYEKDGLYPIQTLVQAVSLRFKYHFEGTRQTNRLDKPEWYFTHVLNVAHEHRSFMDNVVQNLLSSSEYGRILAWHEFALLLLPLLSRKLKRTIPSLLPHPSLLAHTIYQALAFDAALVEEGFDLSGTTAGKSGGISKDSDKWDGVSALILSRKEWFDAWMEGEKKFAEDQYHSIISSPDAWLIADDDGHDEASIDRELRVTHSARRIKALVEQVTDRYAPLPHFSQRTRFLISVQLPLLECYHSRISSSLDAFETLSSAFVRAVPGALGVSLGGSGTTSAEGGARVDTRRLTSGVEGVQRLCKALLSAKFIGASMDAWSEELFFLELWSEINHKASLRARAEVHLSLPDPKGAEAEAPEGTIFEELVHQYGQLVERAEDMVVQQICGEVEGGLKGHFAASNSPRPDQNDSVALSQTLLAPIALLSSHISFLRSILPQTLVPTLYRRITARLAEHIFQRAILYRGRLTLADGKAILAEGELWVETCQAALGGSRNRVEAPWVRLIEAARLVGAAGEAWARIQEATFGFSDDAKWEETMMEVVGVSEMGREEAARVLRIREDCER